VVTVTVSVFRFCIRSTSGARRLSARTVVGPNSMTSQVHGIAVREKVDMRTAALMKGIQRVADAKLVRGIFP